MSTFGIPSSMLDALAAAPMDQPVVCLVRHSVREPLAQDDIGYHMSITPEGRRIAFELGETLGGRLRTLQSSPLTRCVETAEALREGAGVETPIVPSSLLGDPGVFVLDGEAAWPVWQKYGTKGVVQLMMTDDDPLPGMARPSHAAETLVSHMLDAAGDEPGIHAFVSHDAVVMPTASRMLGTALEINAWTEFLEGAWFWRTADGLQVVYRHHCQTIDF